VPAKAGAAALRSNGAAGNAGVAGATPVGAGAGAVGGGSAAAASPQLIASTRVVVVVFSRGPALIRVTVAAALDAATIALFVPAMPQQKRARNAGIPS